jgi:hypothetical protein
MRMSGGRMLDNPGGGIPQLGGPITQEELANRQKMEMNLVMVQNIQQALVMAGDLVRVTGEETENLKAFINVPDREVHNKQALKLHADLSEMQILMLEKFRKSLKDCSPFCNIKGLNLRDIRRKDQWKAGDDS